MGGPLPFARPSLAKRRTHSLSSLCESRHATNGSHVLGLWPKRRTRGCWNQPRLKPTSRAFMVPRADEFPFLLNPG